MKKILIITLCVILISGCAGKNVSAPDSQTDIYEEKPVAQKQETVIPDDTAQDTETYENPPSEAETDYINAEESIMDNIYEYLADEDYQTPEGFDEESEGVNYGELTEIEYFSKTTGVARKCYVYTPPEYDPNVIYPVLYLLHGIGGIHTEWLGGEPNAILSNLIAAGRAAPMIAVMPNVRAAENDGYPSDVFGPANVEAFDNFINDLRDDLMPFIQQNYPVSDKRRERAIAGLSMGGRESLYIGVSMPDTFGYIGAFSPAPGLLANSDSGFSGQLTPEEMTLPVEYKNNTLILICSGNQDGVVNDNPLNYHKAFDNNGIRSAYYTIDGGHDFRVWKNGLYYFAKCIFQGAGV